MEGYFIAEAEDFVVAHLVGDWRSIRNYASFQHTKKVIFFPN